MASEKPRSWRSIRAATSLAPQSNTFPAIKPFTRRKFRSSVDRVSNACRCGASCLSACSFSNCFCWKQLHEHHQQVQCVNRFVSFCCKHVFGSTCDSAADLLPEEREGGRGAVKNVAIIMHAHVFLEMITDDTTSQPATDKIRYGT